MNRSLTALALTPLHCYSTTKSYYYYFSYPSRDQVKPHPSLTRGLTALGLYSSIVVRVAHLHTSAAPLLYIAHLHTLIFSPFSQVAA